VPTTKPAAIAEDHFKIEKISSATHYCVADFFFGGALGMFDS
jgi:hypothetical protein